jgi:two-component system CheB/CheR fusion protein
VGPPVNAPFVTVGIGASAGGIEALDAFFKALPDDHGLAIVVAMHLDPDRGSLLPEILARRTKTPVATAADGQALAAGHVYVLPPGAVLTVKGGRLHLREPVGRPGESMIIDTFLVSLAEDQAEQAIGVILSGIGNDGSLGLKAIKEHGGLAVAQGTDGSEPRFGEMPSSAVALGVDLVLAAERIPEALVAYARSTRSRDEERVAGSLQSIYGLLRTRLGHDFMQYKENTFVRRVQRRMQLLEIAGIDAYDERLQTDPDEARLLLRDLLIGVTDFLRDPAAFRALETQVLPKLVAGRSADDEIRIWVPGCSTGEEAYTIAILLCEHMEHAAVQPHVQIFATDIDENALQVGRAGRYPASLLREVSPERLRRFFVKDGSAYRVTKQIREMCVFSAHSLIRDPPFSRLDLISCRNLLIYFKVDLQARVIGIFHYALRPSGFLLLGISENVSRNGSLFLAIDKKNRIFQRRDLVAARPPLSLLQVPARVSGIAAMGPAAAGNGSGGDAMRAILSTVMDKYAPAYVAVDKDGEVIQYSARTGKYLEPAPGPPSRNLLTMARRGLRPELRAALHSAVASQATVHRDEVAVQVNGSVQMITLTVEPIGIGTDTIYLVIFTDMGGLRSADRSDDRGSTSVEHVAAEQIERELQETKDRLQSTIEELETANEELKSSNEELLSVNEELQSTNEELETSREELQSVNEELQTVNAELSIKVEELDRANSDLRNLFESTEIATIFLDWDFHIRSFTPAATEIFNLIATDRGRPLSDISNRLDLADLPQNLAEVMRRQRALERRVSASDGTTHYLMRILPYRDSDERVAGVLVTFVDIRSVIEAEEHQQLLAKELSHRVKNTLTVVVAMATQTLRRANTLEDFAEPFLGRLHALGFTHDLLLRSNWSEADLHELIAEELAPYWSSDGDAVRLAGPVVSLKPRTALTLGLVFHELATNATKYGALASPEGRVQVSWVVKGRGRARRLELSWLEEGGPSAPVERRRGFGSDLIERGVNFELGGDVRLDFKKGALHCTLSIPCEPEA